MTSKNRQATTERPDVSGRERPGGSGGADAQLADLLEKTKQQLLELAAGLGLKLASKITKPELARRVLAARQPARAAKPLATPVKPVEPKPLESKPVASKPAESKPAVAKALEPKRAGKAAPAATPGPVEPQRTRAAEAVEPGPERKAMSPPAPVLGAPAPGAVPADRPSPAAAARLDLGPGGAAEPRQDHIPWSYGQDRVTAMAVDPESLFAYWEVTDPSLDRARAALGPEGPGAWLNLRVHDISGLIFDGTNAHSFFDHGLGRFDRQWFFHVGRPSSSVIVEIGMRAQSGAFARIARSSRVDFPRNAPAPWTEPEWMTVLASGDVMSAGRGAPARPGAGGAKQGPGPGVGGGAERYEHVPMWVLLEPGEGERRFRELFGEAFERIEWQEAHAEGWYELQGRLEWQVGPMISSWEAGPFTYPVQVDPPTRASWEGGAVAYTANGVTRVLYGPWQVVIKNLGAHSERAELGRWQIYRSWATRGGVEELQGMTSHAAGAPGGASERFAASAWLWQAGSELRLGGASELWRVGASEVRLGGASEVLYGGASERRLAGASERRLAGASEWRMAGASEQRLLGASERRLAGASERALRGASERRLGGASEGRLSGASERRLGASENRLGASENRLGGGGGGSDAQSPARQSIEPNVGGGAPWPRRG